MADIAVTSMTGVTSSLASYMAGGAIVARTTHSLVIRKGGFEVRLVSDANTLTYDGQGMPTGGTYDHLDLVSVAGGTTLETVTALRGAALLPQNLFAGILSAMAGDGSVFDARVLAGGAAFVGNGGNDTFVGGEDDDLVDGGAGNDSLSGGNGQDVLSGGAGDDVLRGTSGDALNGGAGFDTADLSGVAGLYGAVINLATGEVSRDNGSGQRTVVHLAGIEAVIAGTDRNLVIGDEVANRLRGNVNADTLDGGAGGIDTAQYVDSSAGVTVSLLLAGAQAGAGTAAGDRLIGIESVSGSNFADALTGDAAANMLSGLDGADTLTGGLGADTLVGGADNDLLVGGPGSDSLDGGPGSNTATYATSASGIVVRGLAVTNGPDTDSLAAVQTIIGTAFDDDFASGLGNFAVLNGGAGADTFHYSRASGRSTFYDGGTGNDTIDLSLEVNPGSGVSIDLFLGKANSFLTNALDATFASIENVRAGQNGFYDVYASAVVNRIDMRGSDNFVSYDHSDKGVTVNLNLASAQVSPGFAAGDVLLGVDILDGSRLTDTLTASSLGNELRGNDGSDRLVGMAGNDTLLGDEGADTLLGQGGNDVLFGSTGSDSIDGGAGTDTLDFSRIVGLDGSPGVYVNLLAGISTGDGADQLAGIENATGTRFADYLAGDRGANVLTGGDGADTLAGGKGADVLVGGAGADTFVFVRGDAGLSGDVIAGFDAPGAGAGDLIDLTDFGNPNGVGFGAVSQVVTPGLDIVTVTFAGHDPFTFAVNASGALTAADFLF